MKYVVSFYNRNKWHVFEEYGPSMKSTAYKIAGKLNELFSSVEVNEVTEIPTQQDALNETSYNAPIADQISNRYRGEVPRDREFQRGDPGHPDNEMGM